VLSRHNLIFMPETPPSPSPDSDPPTPLAMDSPEAPSQPVQVVRHVSLTQLEALNAVPSENLDGGQTREGCSTIPVDHDMSMDEGTTEKIDAGN
jgi:hypothetical protein